MNELVPAPVAERPSVHEALRTQLVAEIGEARLIRLRDALDGGAFDMALRWLSSEQRSAITTKTAYADDLARFAEWVVELRGSGPFALGDVDEGTVVQWGIYARSRDWSVRTQRRLLSAVSSLWNYAVKRGAAEANPVDYQEHAPRIGTSTNGRPPGATRALEVEETVRLRDACRTDEERIVVDLLYLHGLRVSEVVGQRIELMRLDETPAWIKVQRKGGLWIDRQLRSETERAIRRHSGDRRDGPLLVAPKTGGAKTRLQVLDVTRRLARRAKLSEPNRVTPHTLKAAATTHLLDEGIPVQEVQAWAGHASPTTTQAYWERRHAVRRDAALSSRLATVLEENAAGLGGTARDGRDTQDEEGAGT